MKHEDFVLGMEFACGPDKWRVTDIGMRTVIAINLSNHAAPEGWYEGPPYSVAEVVFDEDDFTACTPSIPLRLTAFGKSVLAQLKAVATAEAQRHLEAGRTVHGIWEGEPIAVSPARAYLLGAEISNVGADAAVVAFWDASGSRQKHVVPMRKLKRFEYRDQSQPVKWTHVAVSLLTRDGANECCLIQLETLDGDVRIVVPVANVHEGEYSR